MDIKNWRLIALSNTIYKLFAKCLVARLSDWCSRYSVLSPCQKGFLPHDGVIEHNFTLQDRKRSARRRKKDFCIAWLDVSNAFGNIPHSAIMNALQAAKTNTAFQDLIQDIYSNCTTQILSQDTSTEVLAIQRGVKQGCPLSGILFNLAIDPTIRRIQGDHDQHRILAFADDIALLTDSPEQLQPLLDLVSQDLRRVALKLNPSKSVAFHLSNSTPVQTCNTDFLLEGQKLHMVQELESHKFLGVPVGYNPVRDLNNLSEIAALAKEIFTSLLAPWQKIDVLKCFFFPAMQFAMLTNQYKNRNTTKVTE
ncbi:Retrovirus-related Pol polyprotein from type-2 retrotransposable element R2DM [Araneus ventricosus]|uniref:Retrovirus-related Pol polyprotein from type-2 retrotransposable element R2DM n=1 Tax=Araneus ventricosus TaxID=182803 RepID=A0A4Y2LS77_ARAVE|nr:Retrovirus-related Pol polyprotein from type-2 retrotransposable element R2DM [Araneus ventricosus]